MRTAIICQAKGSGLPQAASVAAGWRWKPTRNLLTSRPAIR